MSRFDEALCVARYGISNIPDTINYDVNIPVDPVQDLEKAVRYITNQMSVIGPEILITVHDDCIGVWDISVLKRRTWETLFTVSM